MEREDEEPGVHGGQSACAGSQERGLTSITEQAGSAAETLRHAARQPQTVKKQRRPEAIRATR